MTLPRSWYAAPLLLVACSPEAGGEKADKAREAGPARAAVDASQAPAPAPAPAPASQRKADANLVVEPDGLRVFAGASGAARPLPFGMPRQQLLDVIEAFRSPADQGTNSECGAGPLDYAVWADGLTLHFQEGRFAGWALDERAAEAHSTASGIGPGSARRALEAAHDVEVVRTSLGVEFSAGGLYGVLDGTGPEARITAMWAGVSCVFR